VYQFTFPTDHDIISSFMPGLGTKMAQGYVTVVEIEQEAHNQDNEVSILGTGIVELPSRS